jgi:hypothetical protein
VLNQGETLVARGEIADWQWPSDSDFGIQRVHPAFVIFTVSGRMQIQQFAIFAQRLETMGAAFWYYEANAVLIGKHLTMPLQKSRGPRSEVYGYVEYLAMQARDHFALCVRRKLKMQSSHSSGASRERAVDLNDRFANTGRQKVVLAEETLEPTSIVVSRKPLNGEDVN